MDTEDIGQVMDYLCSWLSDGFIPRAIRLQYVGDTGLLVHFQAPKEVSFVTRGRDGAWELEEKAIRKYASPILGELKTIGFDIKRVELGAGLIVLLEFTDRVAASVRERPERAMQLARSHLEQGLA